MFISNRPSVPFVPISTASTVPAVVVCDDYSEAIEELDGLPEVTSCEVVDKVED